MKYILFLISIILFSACTIPPDQIEKEQNSQATPLADVTTQPTATSFNQTEQKQETKEIGTDTCNEFSKDFVGQSIGKEIIKTETQSGGGSNNCEYFLDDKNFVSLTLNNLSVENQKKGAEMMDRKIETNESIKMEHFLTVQEDGNINAIYLILGPNQYVRVDRSSGKEISNEMLVDLAAKVAQKL